jgi:hypothetical protein
MSALGQKQSFGLDPGVQKAGIIEFEAARKRRETQRQHEEAQRRKEKAAAEREQDRRRRGIREGANYAGPRP